MSENGQNWWEPEAWNQQTLEFFTTANPEPDERFITTAFMNLGAEYVPSRPFSQLPSAEFLNSAYTTLGIPLTTASGGKPYSTEGVTSEMSTFQHWNLYYNLLDSNPGWLDLYSTQGSQRQPVSRLCRGRAANYLNIADWTADEAYEVANIIARRQLGGRFPELGSYPLSKVAYILNDRNTNQHRMWQAFLSNPHLPSLGKPDGQEQTVWEVLVDQIMHLCSTGSNKSNIGKLLPYLVANPSIPDELLQECVRMVEGSKLGQVDKTAVFRQFDRNPRFDDQAEKRIKRLAEKIVKFDLAALVDSIRGGRFHVASTWATTSLVCAEMPETETFSREVISAAFDGGNWDLLAYFAPMVGKVIAGQEELLGVEPNTVPVGWVLATA